MKQFNAALTFLLVAVGFTVAITGCDGGGGGTLPDLSGTWYGEGPIDGHHISYTLTMETVEGQLYHAVAVIQSSTLGDYRFEGPFERIGNELVSVDTTWGWVRGSNIVMFFRAEYQGAQVSGTVTLYRQ